MEALCLICLVLSSFHSFSYFSVIKDEQNSIRVCEWCVRIRGSCWVIWFKELMKYGFVKEKHSFQCRVLALE